jgi:hypothetical protein
LLNPLGLLDAGRADRIKLEAVRLGDSVAGGVDATREVSQLRLQPLGIKLRAELN